MRIEECERRKTQKWFERLFLGIGVLFVLYITVS